MVSKELLQAIAVTAELTGTQLSETAARVMCADLAIYPEEQVMGALVRCRKELKGRMTVADVVSRLDDGRPGPEEAWAMLPRDEASSVVWTDEMAQAFGVAAPLLEDDPIQARMAFLESYKAKVQAARDEGWPVKWTPSLGQDSRGRESVLLEAVNKGRLSAPHAQKLLPYNASADVVALIESKVGGLLANREAA